MILNSSIDKSYLYVHLSNMSQPKGIVHICHGKAEHIGRYKWLTSKLNNDGYHVISIDHRGHGNRRPAASIHGRFADGGVARIQSRRLAEYPTQPKQADAV